jgi:hypothetical protein
LTGSAILLLVLWATLSGMEDFVEIRLWGEQRLDFLRRFLPCERGLPARDTLNNVINGPDAELFKTCFAKWVEACAPDIIAIDAKTFAAVRFPCNATGALSDGTSHDGTSHDQACERRERRRPPQKANARRVPGKSWETMRPQMSRPSTFSTSDLTLSDTPLSRG